MSTRLAPSLSDPLETLKNVGPRRADGLRRLGLPLARDLLFHFPRDYQDLTQLKRIQDLVEDEPASVCGLVEEAEFRTTGPGKSTLGVLLRDESDALRCVWFNQPFLQTRFQTGVRVLCMGTPKRFGLRWEMVHPKTEILRDLQESPRGKILPVYSLTEGITQEVMRGLAREAVERYCGLVGEVLPELIRQQHDLLAIHDAIRGIHQPDDLEHLEQSRRRFVFQELFVMQLGLAMRRAGIVADCAAPPLPDNAKISARIMRRFPFDLTEDQKFAISEITADMAGEHPMNRLLQGDVGCGKTVVALYAMLLAVAHGHQAVLMAPTEILARQHFATLSNWLAGSKVSVELLTGAVTGKDRETLVQRVSSGQANLLVGTQAVLNERVEFEKLGLVVIDEQHKFGVRQRARLRQSGLTPHYLVMTATPIPRTVAMTQFGDLEVSQLRERPPGRQPIHTYLGEEESRTSWWKFFRRKLKEGRQGFVIAPLVEDSPQHEIQSAEALYEQLANGELEAFKVDLIHGQQDAAWKDSVMARFREGETQVLIATSVVEVGVDVPNATLMTIENAERFGLAQLHQLRGRVARGSYPGYVCVFSDSESEDAIERLRAFTETEDGFELAEKDFEIRGPGDLFGLRQHGLPPLRVADLQRDVEMIEEARQAAQELVSTKSKLPAVESEALVRMVLARYGKALELGDVG